MEDRLEARLGEMTTEIGILGSQVGSLTETMGSVEGRLESVETTLGLHGDKFDEHSRKLDEHSRKLDEHSRKLDEHSDKFEELISKLDGHIVKTDRGFATVIEMFKQEREHFDHRLDELAESLTCRMESIMGVTREQWADEKRGLGDGFRANRDRLDHLEADVKKLKKIG